MSSVIPIMSITAFAEIACVLCLMTKFKVLTMMRIVMGVVGMALLICGCQSGRILSTPPNLTGPVGANDAPPRGCVNRVPRLEESSINQVGKFTPNARDSVNPEIQLTANQSISQHRDSVLQISTDLIATDDQFLNRADSVSLTPSINKGLSTTQDLPQSDNFLIDLPTALQLAGADNWNVQLAREKVREACEQYRAAKAMWLPNLNVGLGYTHHEGEIQATPGQVIQVSRGSLFAGGGAGISGIPLTGGSGGPARLFVDLSLADAMFEPLYRCQLVDAARSNTSAVFNQVQFDAGAGYFELLRAQSRASAALLDLQESEQLLRTTESFVVSGKGSPADISRMKVIVEQRRQILADANAMVGIASGRLATVLQLDPSKLNPNTILTPVDQSPVPVTLVDGQMDLESLVQQAMTSRPEIAQLAAQVRAAQNRVSTEHWRPLVPNLHMGTSAGGFGGGPGSELPKLDGRFDFDLILAWQVENLGLGTRSARRQRGSQLRQSCMLLAQARDVVREQVNEAYYEIVAGQQQLQIAEGNLNNAADAMEKTVERIRGLEGDPLELVQSLDAMKQSRQDFINATIGFNIAQLKMLQALGQSAGR